MVSLLVVSNMVACLLHPIDAPPALSKWEPLVREEACRQHISPRVVLALIAVESGGNPRARNNQAVGLMQIKPATARMVGYHGSLWRLFSPRNNIHFGVKYLKRLTARYHYGWDAVAAYNCGRPHWQRGRGFVCLGQSTNYVKKVAQTYKHLHARSVLAFLAYQPLYPPY